MEKTKEFNLKIYGTDNNIKYTITSNLDGKKYGVATSIDNMEKAFKALGKIIKDTYYMEDK